MKEKKQKDWIFWHLCVFDVAKLVCKEVQNFQAMDTLLYFSLNNLIKTKTTENVK